MRESEASAAGCFFARKRSVSGRMFFCAKAKRQRQDVFCAKAKRQRQDVGHEGVITGRDAFSLRSPTRCAPRSHL
ncbi:hypothetical protein FJQ98_06655 [Lysinibacillus agricola]|uniref:Uncharacterized protein n=1 Tax=Lysinibacillus agricola TaxID=2590012 RepID=A0ABX7AWR3_9BACI|nr:hypothetical protein [Lysinibacillus agricola]QQP13727.1 hypothetical protein FJQ98_06655 [Lysinibacillus agricola]